MRSKARARKLAKSGEDSLPGSARGLEWMPGIDLQPGSAAAGELDSRGGQSTEFPFLGVLMEENAAPGKSVRPRSQRALGTPPPGSHS
ncbi:hypothetical protein JEQ12_003783 [Ovis aries]|uniref:Uncharacterized protein n=1 Tax=Ovis aries TaxID=9940 RepID=A0A836CYJ5_SHEEP|nr:hypothetical protein JEQ12_003783 [Ovis aries]